MPDHPNARMLQAATELASHVSERDPELAALFRRYAEEEHAAILALTSELTSHVGDVVLYFMAIVDERVALYWTATEREEMRERVIKHLEASTQAMQQIARLGRLPDRITTTFYRMIGIVTLEIAVISLAFFLGMQRPMTPPPALAAYAPTPVVVAAHTLCPGQTLVFTPTRDIRSHPDQPDTARQAHVVRTWRVLETGRPAIQRDSTPVPVLDSYTNILPGAPGAPQAFEVPNVPPNTYRFDTTVSGAGMTDSGYRIDVTVPASCFTGVRP